MDSLDCKICQVPYDEDEHRPRHAPCGHEFCSTCIRALIKDNIFVCPKCRRKNKVDVMEDLPVSFGLIDVIRAFKTMKNPIIKESKPRISETINTECCKVHLKAIRHRCFKCNIWICDECLDSHSSILGCSTINSSDAMNNIKEKNTENMNELRSNFKEDNNHLSSKIQEHNNMIHELTEKRKKFLEIIGKHGKEVENLQNLIEEGNSQLEKLTESENQLKSANSPYAVMDSVEVLTQRKQLLRSWSVKTKADSLIGLLMTIKKEKCVYVEMAFNKEKLNGKLSQYNENIYLHTIRKQEVTDCCMLIPFASLQKLLPPCPTLLFLELSLGDVVKGHVLLRLSKDLPNIREYMVTVFTGQHGVSLCNVEFKIYGNECIGAVNLPFKDIKVVPDIYKSNTSEDKRGDVTAYFNKEYLNNIYFLVRTCDYCSNDTSVGSIESGMDIIQECYDNHSLGVKVSDCGLVIELE